MPFDAILEFGQCKGYSIVQKSGQRFSAKNDAENKKLPIAATGTARPGRAAFRDQTLSPAGMQDDHR
ncbi:hypothetical protein [Shinella zoogloeoides]|jgi:hypothetical protein|uniref:hypothetical protein n=1 Tax=Shinella zoogloeoides TaxID=352475 RepID=UPI000E647DE1|nr:hypothetical protein [Shinella zoogloeoides]